MSAVDDELLGLLACPRCKGALEHAGGGEALVCPACALRYPVRDGIPVLLVDEASPVESD